MKKIKIFFLFIKVFFKKQIVYKFNFWASIFVNINSYIVTYLGMWIIFQNFKNIQGWFYEEIVFIYTVDLLTYGIASLIFSKPMIRIEELVKTGEFDLILVRPINSFFFLLLKEMDFKYIGHIILSICVLFIDLSTLEIKWTTGKIIVSILNLIGGISIQSSFIIIAGSLSIKYILSASVLDLLTYNIRQFIHYPLEIYNKVIIIILTLFIPYGFVNYYPIKYILDRNLTIYEELCSKFGTIIIAFVLYELTRIIYKQMINNYCSTGN